MTEDHVVEIEFIVDQAAHPLGRVSQRTGCVLDVELVVPRSDGQILAFIDVAGAPWRDVLDTLEPDEGVVAVRRLRRDGGGSLLEVVLDGRPVTVLADAHAVVTRLAAAGGRWRVVADVPPHIDTGRVIERFVDAYPSAHLVARRRTDRRTPLLGRSQFVTRVLSQFTERQLHVLRVAYDKGYFQWPRASRADEVADALDISTPTFSQHIRAIERKLTRVLFEG